MPKHLPRNLDRVPRTDPPKPAVAVVLTRKFTTAQLAAIDRANAGCGAAQKALEAANAVLSAVFDGIMLGSGVDYTTHVAAINPNDIREYTLTAITPVADNPPAPAPEGGTDADS